MSASDATAPPASEPLRVLMVEDSPDDEELVVRELRHNGYVVAHRRVEAEDEMRAALAERTWDIILSDFALPRFSGAAALQIVRELDLDIPFIIVSGTVGEETAVAIMRDGASDYVLKDSLARLCPAVARELRDSARRKEQRVLRERLLVADRMASIGTLAAGVAHEINNPLAAVVANLELATKELTAFAAKDGLTVRLRVVLEELRDARESADRLRNIVRDLRIFSRAPDAEQRGPVDVHQVLESGLRLAWNEIRHRAEVRRDFGPVPPVLANEARLGQVFLNLFINAAQAIGDGGAERNSIRVTTRHDPTADQVIIEVSDTGVGIPAANLARVFDAFFTTKEIGVGTGLGLAICHTIVSGLGGGISVDSAVGLGTTFRVALPATRPGIAFATPPPVGETQAPATSSRRARVLVVDDELMILRAIRRMLQDEHEVVMVSSASEAIARLASDAAFDLILCDLMMPQMSGMDLHAELTRTAPEMAARMVFLTGGAFTPGARAFLDHPDHPHLEKPFDSQTLRRFVAGRLRAPVAEQARDPG